MAEGIFNLFIYFLIIRLFSFIIHPPISKIASGICFKILEKIIRNIPPPQGNPDAPLQALIFDSVYNSFRGIIVYFKILNGEIHKADHVKFIATGKEYYADAIGVL